MEVAEGGEHQRPAEVGHRLPGVLLRCVYETDFSLWNPGNNAANPSTPGTSTNNLISEAKAKEIALAKAPSGASVVRCHLDWDDGHYIYEIKMVSGTMEYECDINAATGVITGWDVDSIYD